MNSPNTQPASRVLGAGLTVFQAENTDPDPVLTELRARGGEGDAAGRERGCWAAGVTAQWDCCSPRRPEKRAERMATWVPDPGGPGGVLSKPNPEEGGVCQPAGVRVGSLCPRKKEQLSAKSEGPSSGQGADLPGCKPSMPREVGGRVCGPWERSF